MSWDVVGMVEVLLMVPFATLFPILYGVFFPWFNTPQGRAVFVQSVGMALLVDFAVAYKFLPGWLPPKPPLAAFVYFVILAGQAGLVVSLLLAWHNRHNHHEGDPHV